MTKKAPIIIFAYNRLSHLKKTVFSLSAARGIDAVDLIIFSDGPRPTNEDKQKVAEVRKFLGSIDQPFNSIRVVERTINFGLSGNVINGVDEVLAENESAIILEDDIIVSPDFVETMQALLEKYRDRDDIGSVSGYMYPVKIPPSTEDFFLLPRASSWGWATWSDRWRNVDWHIRDFDAFLANKEKQRLFDQGGEDLSAMLIKWKYGLNDSWAVRWSYHHFKQGMQCLFPKRSMVVNYGNDGSGTHSPNTTRFGTYLESPGPYIIPKDPSCNRKVLLMVQSFFKPSTIRRIINKILFMYYGRSTGK